MATSDSGRRGRPRTVGFLVVLVLVVSLPVWLGFFKSFQSADGGQVGVIRNGGLFDNTSINTDVGDRGILHPNSGNVSTGLWSNTHFYPAGQRFFQISTAVGADQPGNVSVVTSDGYSLAVEGIFYFQLNEDPAVLSQFDDLYGTREFDIPGGERDYPWESDAGWNALLALTFGTFSENAITPEFSKYSCQQVIPSCALISQVVENPDDVNLGEGSGAETVRQSIQTAIVAALSANMKSQLGGDYFTNLTFVLSKPTLNDSDQANVQAVLAKYAAINQANADQQTALVQADTAQQQAVIQAETDVKVAQQQAAANQVRQDGYNACPTCAVIDQIEALPDGLLVYGGTELPGLTVQVP